MRNNDRENIEQKVKDVVDKALMELVKKGYAEMFVGEDGEFFFQATQKGISHIEKLQGKYNDE